MYTEKRKITGIVEIKIYGGSECGYSFAVTACGGFVSCGNNYRSFDEALTEARRSADEYTARAEAM